MKKKYCYVTAVALLGLVACSEDHDLVVDGSGNGSVSMDGRIPLTFRLEGLSSGSVGYTRAGEIALTGEKEIRTLDVFVFGKDTLPDGTEKPDGGMLLEEVFRSGVSEGITLSTDGAVQKAELSVMGNNRKRLYFVANGREEGVLNRFELGKTDTLAFRDGLTDALTGHIACPLLMTADMGLSVKDSLEANSAWKGENLGITLKRRMARFDIVNTGVDSQFFIEWIQLVNSRKQSYLFEDAAHETPYYAASELWDPERIDYLSLDNANNGETLAAFYAYAAPEEEGDDTKDFSIVLGGKSGSTGEGTAVLYPVLMRTDQEKADTKLSIKANNRYVINIKSVGSNVITASIEVQDWLKSDTVKVESGYGIFGLSMPETEPKGTMAANTLTLNAAAPEEGILVKVAADTEWLAETDCEWLELTGTPEEGKVGKTLTFKTSKANPRNDKARVGRIVFRNKMRPSITQTLLVEQPVNESGTYLNVDMPKDITGLSIQGDTMTLPGYAMDVRLALAGTNAASTTASCPNTDMATKVALNTANDSIVVTLAANTSGADREGVLTVTNGDLEQKYHIVQKAQSLGIILLSGEGIIDRVLSLGITDTYGKTVSVKASSPWKFANLTAEGDGSYNVTDWLTLSDVTGNDAGNGSFTLTTTENTSFDAREVEIRVVNEKKEGIFSVLTVKQAGKPETFTVSADGLQDNTLTIAQDATSAVTLTVTADLKDGEWELVDAGNDVGTGEWLTLGTKSGDTFTVTPKSANDGTADRSVTITVQKVGDESVKQDIIVTQTGTGI